MFGVIDRTAEDVEDATVELGSLQMAEPIVEQLRVFSLELIDLVDAQLQQVFFHGRADPGDLSEIGHKRKCSIFVSVMLLFFLFWER